MLVQRTAEHLLREHGLITADVNDPVIINDDVQSARRALESRVLEAARKASGCHALIIHADSDYPTRDRAYQERFLPGADLVHRTSGAICKSLIPVIPVRSTEAWMLADSEALSSVIGIDIDLEAVGIPVQASQVENIAHPKDVLNHVIRSTSSSTSGRRRRINAASIHEPLARVVRLDRLLQVPSFRQFADDLLAVLRDLHFAS